MLASLFSVLRKNHINYLHVLLYVWSCEVAPMAIGATDVYTGQGGNAPRAGIAQL